MTTPALALFQDWRRWPIEWALRRTTPPTFEPFTLDEVRGQLRLEPMDDDALLQGYIIAAREAMEDVLSKSIMSQTWELNLSRPPAWELPLPRTGSLGWKDLLTSVTSVTYIDMNGAQQTRPSNQYIVDAHHQPVARILPFGIDPTTGNQDVPIYWLPTRYVPNAMTVTYVAGVTARGDVPQMVRQAMLMLVGSMYESREADALAKLARLPLYDALIDAHRSTWEPEFA